MQRNGRILKLWKLMDKTTQKLPRKSATKDGKNGLNSQQLKFCREIAKGQNNTRAYKSAYKGVTSDRNAVSAACTLLTNLKVIKEIEKLREAVETRSTLSRLEKRQFLKRAVEVPITELDTKEGSENADLIQEKIVTVRHDKKGLKSETTKIKGMSKLEAIKIDNLMQGDNAPEEVNNNFTGELVMNPIQFVRQDKKARAAALKASKEK